MKIPKAEMKYSTSGIYSFLTLLSVALATKRDTPILIVGAGSAGLSAARKLLENGFESVKILEAEPRIGGRINSVFFGDSFVDLGARWCHGQNDNVVYEMVKNLELLGHTEMPSRIYHSSRTPVDEDFATGLFEIMEKIYSVDGNYPARYVSLGDYCEEQFNATIHEQYGKDEQKLRIAKDAMDYFELDVISNEGSSTWFESTAQNDYEECDGDLAQNWKGKGYKTFLEVLMKKYPKTKEQFTFDDKIFLQKEVIKITWNDSKPTCIVAHCSDGSTYSADHLVFTPSIGVLKERMVDMFVPMLPQEKIMAIKNMGFGPVMKLVMHYSEVWWKNDINGFNFIWSEEDKIRAMKEFPIGPNLDGRSWVTYTHYSLPVENNPSVLVAWFTGKLVPKIEMLSNDTLARGITYVYKKFMGQIYNISVPDEIIHSDWYSNPHFRGSYSYQTPAAKNGDKATNAQEDLAKPIETSQGRPVLLFAGEGTHAHYYSNVHGAVESGFREADRIISYYKNAKIT